MALLTSDIMLQHILTTPNRRRPFDETKNTIIRRLNISADDDDMRMDVLKISLLDSLMRTRIRIPARAAECTHLQCFDLNNYLVMCEKRPTFNCPICDKIAISSRLIIDDYFEQLLKDVGPDIDAVELLRDGTWRITQQQNNGIRPFCVLLDSDVEMEREGGDADAEFVMVCLPSNGAGEGGAGKEQQQQGGGETASTDVGDIDIPRHVEETLQNLLIQIASQGREGMVSSSNESQPMAQNGLIAHQQPIKIGIIGGTGLEDPDIMERVAELDIDTPFGRPSDSLIQGTVDGIPVVLMSRHGRRHHLSPTNINYRANIWALKKAGVSVIIASAACGSLREDLAPGHVVVLDSFIDRTTKREQTFYDDKPGHPQGICHMPMHPAFSEKLRQLLISVVDRLGIPHQSRGALVCVEGPRFSTRAESEMFRQWPNASVVGMTVCPEAVLAKELGIPYASLAVVTDYDCWRDTAEGVSIDLVAEMMKKNAAGMKLIFRESIKAIRARQDEFRAEAEKAKKLAIASVMDGGKELDFDHLE